MANLTQEQWMWIIGIGGIGIAILIFVRFWSKGNQFELGSAEYVPRGTPVPSRPYCMPCGLKGTTHELANRHMGLTPPYDMDSFTKPYKAPFHDEERWLGKY